MVETVLGVAISKLLLWAGIGVLLLVGLVVLKFVLKLSMSFIKLGCLGISVMMLIACVAMILPG